MDQNNYNIKKIKKRQRMGVAKAYFPLLLSALILLRRVVVLPANMGPTITWISPEEEEEEWEAAAAAASPIFKLRTWCWCLGGGRFPKGLTAKNPEFVSRKDGFLMGFWREWKQQRAKGMMGLEFKHGLITHFILEIIELPPNPIQFFVGSLSSFSGVGVGGVGCRRWCRFYWGFKLFFFFFGGFKLWNPEKKQEQGKDIWLTNGYKYWSNCIWKCKTLFYNIGIKYYRWR